MTVMEQVKRVCFGLNIESREGLHRSVMNELKELFIKGGYIVYPEYPIRFDSKAGKKGERISRNGYIDLMAVKNGRRIAIEFDNGVNLKFKSVEKLFQIDADLRIGIVRGKSETIDFGIDRIRKLLRKFDFPSKSLRVISLTEKKICSL